MQNQPALPAMNPNGMGFQVDGQPMLLAYQDPHYSAPVNMMPLGGGHQMNLTIGNGTDPHRQDVKDITAGRQAPKPSPHAAVHSLTRLR